MEKQYTTGHGITVKGVTKLIDLLDDRKTF